MTVHMLFLIMGVVGGVLISPSRATRGKTKAGVAAAGALILIVAIFGFITALI